MWMDSENGHGSNMGRRPSGIGRLVAATASLQFKATLLVVVLTLSVTAAVSGYLLRSSVKLARAQHDEQLVQLAAMLARSAAAPCAERNLAALEMLAAEAANGTPLLYALFTDVDGRELAAAQHASTSLLERLRRHGSRKPVFLGTPVYHKAGDGTRAFLDVAYPINLNALGKDSIGEGDTKLVGYVRAGITPNRWHQIMSSKLDLVVGVGSVATGVAIVLGFILIRRIVSPLEGLAQAMGEFSQGNLDIRSPVERQDEIGNLEVAFNRMADQHQQTHKGIVRLNAELEQRVAERTQQLRELAARDPLTGLYNRRHFNEVLDRSFSEAVRYENELSCIMLDLDDFKGVNDAFGHQVGDQLLKLVVTTISSQLRSADLAARYGGDEFIVLLPQTDAVRARVLAGRITEKLAKDLAVKMPQVRITMSLGVASLQGHRTPDAESLVRTSDRAMYEAKAEGKNRIVTAESAAGPTSRLAPTAAKARG
jgi:diguanylate cyclase (GGDEF)-like protein